MERLIMILGAIKAEIGKESFRKKYAITEKDFTRNRKMPMKDVMLFVLCNARTILSEEVYNFCRKTGFKQVSAAAMTKARSKIDYKAFEYLLKVCNTNISKDGTYKGYYVLAVDGMKGELPKTKELMEKNSRKRNLFPTFHAVTTYDIINQHHVNGIFEVGVSNERKIARQLLEQGGAGGKEIYLYDRGFPEVELLQMLEAQGKYYVMRVTNSFLTEVRRFYQEETVDKTIHIDYNRWRGKNKGRKTYSFDLRMVKIELIGGEIEVLITNLSNEEFKRKHIGGLYGLRWGIESSYNELKNSMFIEDFISKKENLIKQEFFATLIVYNMSKNVRIKACKGKKKTKLKYKINFRRAVGLIASKLPILFYMTEKSTQRKIIEEIKARIITFQTAIRRGRKFPRIFSECTHSVHYRRCFFY